MNSARLNRVLIPSEYSSKELAYEIKRATEDTIIVVESEEKKNVALLTAVRLRKEVAIEVHPDCWP